MFYPITRVISLLSLLVVALVFTSCTPTPEPADLVLVGGKFVTLDPARPEATALAARAGKIVAVGSDEQIRAFIGPRTEGVQLDGRLAVPGFIESHGHLRNLGILRMNVDLKTTRSWEEIVERVREAAGRAKPGSWIFGRGWHQEKWDHVPARTVEGYPLQDALNEAAPLNPVVLKHASGHAVIAEHAALRAAGIVRRQGPLPAAGSSAMPRAGDRVMLETAADLG
jgi:predicted amidohydrolase YtcJ